MDAGSGGLRGGWLVADLAIPLRRPPQPAGKPTGTDEYVVRNLRGDRITRQRVTEILREAARRANETRERQGLPPLPRTTPHTLRRAYISIALLANRFDVKWVMSQVGHADSKMTLDVYASSSSGSSEITESASTRSCAVPKSRCTARASRVRRQMFK